MEKQLFNQKKHLLQPLTDVSTEKSVKPPGKEKPVKENFSSGHPQTTSPEKGKGKGKGGGYTPKPRNVKPNLEAQPPRFSATIFCKWCKKKGHYEDRCWSKEKWEKSQKKKSENTPAPVNQTQVATQIETDANPKKRKVDAMRLLAGRTYTVPVRFNGQNILKTLW